MKLFWIAYFAVCVTLSAQTSQGSKSPSPKPAQSTAKSCESELAKERAKAEQEQKAKEAQLAEALAIAIQHRIDEVVRSPLSPRKSSGQAPPLSTADLEKLIANEERAR
jgi:hypothetical protein